MRPTLSRAKRAAAAWVIVSEPVVDSCRTMLISSLWFAVCDFHCRKLNQCDDGSISTVGNGGIGGVATTNGGHEQRSASPQGQPSSPSWQVGLCTLQTRDAIAEMQELQHIAQRCHLASESQPRTGSRTTAMTIQSAFPSCSFSVLHP